MGQITSLFVRKVVNEVDERVDKGAFDAEVSKLEAESSLQQRVQAQIARSLSEGVPTIPDVAKHLGMSGRTLQRRLSDLGYSYKLLVDETRHRLAKRLLEQTDFSLAEVREASSTGVWGAAS